MKILLGSCSSFSNIHSCKFINVFVVVVVDVAVGVGVVPRQRRRGVMNAKAAQTDRRQKEFSVRIRIVHYVYATATGYVKWLGLVIFFEYGHCRRLRFLHFCFCGDSRRAASRKKQGQMRRAHMHFFWSTAIFHIGNFQASWKILTKWVRACTMCVCGENKFCTKRKRPQRGLLAGRLLLALLKIQRSKLKNCRAKKYLKNATKAGEKLSSGPTSSWLRFFHLPGCPPLCLS